MVIELAFQGTDDERPIVKFIDYATYKHENSDQFWDDVDSDVKAWSRSSAGNNTTSGNTDDAQCTDCSGLGPQQTGYLLAVIIFCDISLISGSVCHHRYHTAVVKQKCENLEVT